MPTSTDQTFSKFSYVFTGGSQVFVAPFALGVLTPDHIQAFVEGEMDGLDEQLYRPFIWDATNSTVTITTPIVADGGNPVSVIVQRTVPKDTLYISFASNADVSRTNIDTAVKYTLMALHETLDGRWDSSAWNVLYAALQDTLDARDLAEAWAQSLTAPDPLDPTSMSAKSWAQLALAAVEDATELVVPAPMSFEYIATSGQTVFTGVDLYGRTLSIGGSTAVFHEGTAVPPSSYTVSVGGGTITLADGLFLGDRLVIQSMPAVATRGSENVSYDGSTVYDALNRASFAEIAPPYTIKPLGYRWPLQAFQGAKAELAKSPSIQDWTPVLDKALKSGENIHVSRGVWNMRSKLYAASGIKIADDTPVDVYMTGGAEIKLTSDVPWFTGGFFDIRTVALPSVSSKVPFRWIGGKINTEDLVVNPALGPSGMVAFDLFQRSNYRFQDVVFSAGINKNGGLWGNIDTFIVTHNCAGGVIDNCYFEGAYDAGIYMSGNFYPDSTPAWDFIGEDEQVSNCRFRRTNNMVTFKRDHMGAKLLNNYGYEVNNGYLASPASGRAGNQGEVIQITGGRLIKVQARPIYMATGLGCHISNVLIEDFGHSIVDPTVLTSTAIGNNIAGIDLRGVKSGMVHDNTIRQREWAGGTASAAGCAILGIRTGYNDDEAIYSTDCLLHHNKIEQVHRPVYDDAGCARNRYEDNTEVPGVSGTVLPSAVLGASSILLKPILHFAQTIDPAAIPANGEAVYVVPAPGVVPGDYIDSWTLGPRSSSSPGVGAVNIEVYAITDGVEFVLINRSSSSKDFANTIFNVRVRKQ